MIVLIYTASDIAREVAENQTEQDVSDILETLKMLMNMLADEDAAEALAEAVRALASVNRGGLD